MYEQSFYESAQEDMIHAGVSSSFANAVIDTAQSFNSGMRWALEAWSESNTAPTTLKEFVKEAIEIRALG